MQIEEFLTDLSGRGIQLGSDNGQLRFHAPVGVMTPELRVKILERKEEILAAFLANVVIKKPEPATLKRVSRSQELPLSYAQERFWILDQMEPGNTAYNLPNAVRIRGKLKVELLERCLLEIVRRHEVLRTRFDTRNGMPVQIIYEPDAVVLEQMDLRGQEVENEERLVQELMAVEAQHRFDLSRGPLVRAKLLIVKNDEYVLLLTFHHIVFDGWSGGVFLGEFIKLYSAFDAGTESPLSELLIQYVDYAVWQRDWLRKNGVVESQIAYWREQLKDLKPLELPRDRPRPPVRTYRGNSHRLTIENELLIKLEALSRKEGLTLFMLLSAAFKTLLWRYTGQDEIAIGAPIANRTSKEVEALIGFFVNTLVLRTDLAGNPSFIELLRQERKVILEAYEHQDMPFDKLVEQLQPARDLSRSPLFQVMLVLQNAPQEQLSISGLDFEWILRERKTIQFDLVLSLHKNRGELSCELEFNSDLFDLSRIERMGTHWRNLLAEIVVNPRQPLSAFKILRAEERTQILISGKGMVRDYPNCKCIHEYFEEQVQRTPQAIAVVCGNQSLSYDELNRRVNVLARALAKEGVAKGSYVPFLMDQGIDVPISQLGIMKTGAAFVPIDPSWPEERIRLVLDDLDCNVLIANDSSFETARFLGRRVIRASQSDDYLSSRNLDVTVDSEDPIYVIYTSGSTGKPKGVIVPHRGITNRFLWMDEFFGREAAQSVLQTTRHVYDSSVWQLLWPLTCGGKTVIPPAEGLMAADAVADLISKNQITMTDFVPSVFNAMVPAFTSDAAIKEQLTTLRCLVIGGEEITASSIKAFQMHFPHVWMINLYGPTEASIGCIAYKITGLETNGIPIGKPIANVQALILDAAGNLVPEGVVGELYLTGKCIGLGYLNDRKKTEAVFVPNPFAEVPFPTLYRTGDLACFRPDGNIDFCGRKDYQVKVRGQRIELGEIENTINGNSAVQQGVVVALEAQAGNKRLIGYIVGKQGATISVSELRDYLKSKLPEYMVPSAFIFMEKLPLTSNGKVDRKALPLPSNACADPDVPFVPAQTVLEKEIAEIWKEQLCAERIGIHDNFFELGGHSLLAIQTVFNIKKKLNINFTVTELIQNPTIASLISTLGKKTESGGCNAVPDGSVLNFSGPRFREVRNSFQRWVMRNDQQPANLQCSLYPVFSLQKMDWTLNRLGYGCDVKRNQAIEILLRADLCEEKVDALIRNLLETYEALRTSFVIQEDTLCQRVDHKVDCSIVHHDLTGLEDAAKRDRIREIKAAAIAIPFDFSRGPLTRFVHVRLDTECHAIILATNHIVADGYSELVYRAHLADAVNKLCGPEMVPVKNVVSAGRYSAWLQNEFKEGGCLKFVGDYWKNYLAGFAQKAVIPHSKSLSPETRSGQSAGYRFVIGSDVTELLRRSSIRKKASVANVFISSVFTWIYNLSGCSDIVITVPHFNRPFLELKDTPGFLTGLAFIRKKITANLDFDQLVSSIGSDIAVIQDTPNFPYQELYQYLGRKDEFDHIFTLMVNVLSTSESRAGTLADFTSKHYAAESAVKWEMQLNIVEYANAIEIRVRYFRHLYSEKDIESYFRLLVQEIVERSESILNED